MEVIVDCCAGLDVHQATVVACVNRSGRGGRSHKEIRSFGTMPDDLTALRDWLLEAGVTQVAMESTGVYWKPVYAALEDHFEVIVANAQHVKNVPGRKTDVKDCDWLSDLQRHGLIRPGFVPPRPIRELRELCRYRNRLVQLQAGDRNRLIKVLETAGIKLAGVASDVFGVSGRAMLRALIAGEASAAAMAGLARGMLRRKCAELARALAAPLRPHQRLMLATQLARVEQTEADLQRLDAAITEMVEPYQQQLRQLMSIPGIDWLGAVGIIAEIGVDMSRFRSAEHLASWTAVCPGNNESAGRQRSGRTRKGNVFLKTILMRAGFNGARRQGSYFSEKFRRLAVRRGRLRAGMAIAHKMLVVIWHMLRDGTFYQDPGAACLDRMDRTRTASRLVKRLTAMGFDVQLNEAAA
jgi:transposase